MKVETITKTQFQNWCHRSKVLVKEPKGVKVLETPEEHIIKIFMPRKSFSSAKLWPHALRFARNAKRLQARGVSSITIKKICYCWEKDFHIAVYPKLPGDEVRQLVHSGNTTILEKLPAYLADLHAQGIFFRGIHLGNVLLQTNGEFSLIDIVDVRFKRNGLNAWQCARNIAHLLSDKNDQHIFTQQAINDFITAYLEHSQLSSRGKRFLRNQIQRKLKV